VHGSTVEDEEKILFCQLVPDSHLVVSAMKKPGLVKLPRLGFNEKSRTIVLEFGPYIRFGKKLFPKQG